MIGRSYQLRFVILIAGTSLLLLVICTLAAVYLYRQQSGTAEVLGENIGSRRAAASLEESLRVLIAMHRNQARQVVPLQERIEAHLQEIRDLADKPEEQILASKLEDSFQRYCALWQATPKTDSSQAVLAILEEETLPLCRQLREYNTRQVEESERAHHRAIALLAWGLAGVGGAASLVGLLLGYAFSRGLSQSIHQLQVRVLDAANKLGQDLPPVSLNGDGDLEALHGQMQDLVRQVEQVVQKLHQREREVRRADQMAATGRLAAGVAHEIRNPLTSIKMLVQAGQEDAAARGMPSEDLKVIEREIRRMENSLQAFLNFARPPKLRRSPQDLASLVNHTLDLIRGRAAKQQVRLQFDSPPGETVPLDADGEQLQQVLVNLSLNGLDAMPRGGTLQFVLHEPTAGAAELSVSDTGPGVAPAMMPRLFEPFASDKETGLGLGLVVSRRIAEDHGGTLRAFNRAEGGACFTLRLPVGAHNE